MTGRAFVSGLLVAAGLLVGTSSAHAWGHHGWGGFRHGFGGWGFRHGWGGFRHGFGGWGWGGLGYRAFRPYWGGYWGGYRGFGFAPYWGYRGYWGYPYARFGLGLGLGLGYGYGYGYPLGYYGGTTFTYTSYPYLYTPYYFPCALGGTVAANPPATYLSTNPSAPVQRPVLTTPATPPASDGTFPYDGGPQTPVPAPGAVPSPPRTAPAPTVPLEGRTVSLPRQAPKWNYPAYGQRARRMYAPVEDTLLTRSTPVKSIAK